MGIFNFRGDDRPINPPAGTDTGVDELGRIVVETPSGASWRLLPDGRCEQLIRVGRAAGTWITGVPEPGWGPTVRAGYSKP